MVGQIVSGNTEKAVRIFHALTLLIMLVVLCIGVPVILFAFFFPWSGYFKVAASAENLNIAITSVCAYGLVSLQMSVIQAGFRANGSYALGAALSHTLRLIESAAMLAAAELGQDLAVCAVILAGARIIGTIAITVVMHQKVKWLTFSFSGAPLSDLGRLLRPAVTVMLFPVAFSMSLQGMTLLIAAEYSVKAVVVFSAVRTLTRLGLQAVAVVTQAVMPEYSAAVHTDRARLTRLLLFNIVAAVGISLILAIILIVGGAWFIEYWSARKIDAPLTLISLMSVLMVVQALSTVPLNLLISVNRHATSGLVMFVGALVALAVTAELLPGWGLNGVATVLLCTEIATLVIYFDQAAKRGLLDLGSLQQQLCTGLARFK